MAVLMAVRFQLLCILLRRIARGHYTATHYIQNSLCEILRSDCNSLQNLKKQTQNPPIARSWGFDPPSRHHKTIHLVDSRLLLILGSVQSLYIISDTATFADEARGVV